MRGLERPRHACPELDEGPAFAAVKVNARPGWKSELPCPRTTWVALGTWGSTVAAMPMQLAFLVWLYILQV